VLQNGIAAFELGVRLLGELPLSLRLLREVHAPLLRGVRGEEKSPGELRTSNRWIGPPERPLAEATLIPPRDEPEMAQALADWERSLHERDGYLPPLVASALVHHQFEACVWSFRRTNG